MSKMQLLIRAISTVAVLVALSALPALGQNADTKIDPELMRALAADQNAPFFVLFRERGLLNGLSQIPDRAERARQVIQSLSQTAESSQRVVRGMLERSGIKFTPFWVTNAIFVNSGDLALARGLASRPEVTAIKKEPVFAIPDVVSGTSDAATQAIEWNIARIRADQSWASTTGAGMVVANIDTGVRYTHGALVSQYRGNTGAGFNHQGNWFDPTGRCSSAPCDNVDHGTHTMGTMVGAGGIGVAPGAKWIACKGCANGSLCSGSTLMACAQWVMDPLNNGTGAGQPDVVNNSWGGAGGNEWFLSFVQSWRASGIFPAFSAGNSGPSCGSVGSPGDYAVSFAAGATNESDQIASFSARGPSSAGVIKPDASAPGVSIRSSVATSDTSYAVYSGTSMASPHMAGTVALLWAANGALRGAISTTEKILRDSSVPYSSSENCGGTADQIPGNTYGAGRLDALAALLLPPPTGGSAPAVTITNPANGSSFSCPATVGFSGTATDTEDGDLSYAVSWSDNGSLLGQGASFTKAYACTQAGNHSIVAQVTDGSGMSDLDTIQIAIAAACVASGGSCSANSDCCSGRCTTKKGSKSCR